LDTALEKEKETYEKCPPRPDLASDHEIAQGWGFVVAGYFLIEEALKALLHVRKKKVEKIHHLSDLFKQLDERDQPVFREYYTDYRSTIGGKRGKFPFESLDDFLKNLDGYKKDGYKKARAFDWRYFLIEKRQSQEMPLVSIDYMHEIVYGCIRIIECANSDHDSPLKDTRSWRMFKEREEKYTKWLLVRMNSEGWEGFGDRCEILWGPDYLGRCDIFFFRGKEHERHFSKIPDNPGLPLVDKRMEFETFDAEER